MVLAQARGSNEKQFCRMLWDFTVQMDHEICGRIPDAIVVQKGKNLCQIIKFSLPLWWKTRYQRIRKNRASPKFGKKVQNNMELESQGYTTSDRYLRNNIHKVNKLVKGNGFWNPDNRVVENCPPTHCSNPPKGS